MRYTKFFIDQTISKVKSNPAVRKAATGGYRALHGSGKLGLKGISAVFGLLLHPASIGIIAAIAGIFMVVTVAGNLSTVMMNMTSSSSGGLYSSSVASAYGSSFSALSSVSSLLPLVIMMMVGGMALFGVLGMLNGVRGDYGGAM